MVIFPYGSVAEVNNSTCDLSVFSVQLVIVNDECTAEENKKSKIFELYDMDDNGCHSCMSVFPTLNHSVCIRCPPTFSETRTMCLPLLQSEKIVSAA